MASSKAGRSTYTIEVLNVRGRVVETKEVTRRSQEGAHRVARQVLVEHPRGTKMVLKREGEVVERLTRTAAGWDYEVLNGGSVRDAQRNWVKTHKPSTEKARHRRKVA